MYKGEVKRPNPDLNTVKRIYKNDKITKTHAQDREGFAVHQERHRQVNSHKKNVYNWEKNKHMWQDKNECWRCGYNHMDRTCPAKGTDI